MYNVVYSNFFITLFNIGNVLMCVIYQLNFTVLMYVTRISRYIYRSVLSAEDLGTDCSHDFVSADSVSAART
jgi:hypothetical protein